MEKEHKALAAADSRTVADSDFNGNSSQATKKNHPW